MNARAVTDETGAPTVGDERRSLVCLLTALADDELVIGHRHSEWTGFAPHIEEDVAFSSIAQDEIGHAAAYYSLLAELTGSDADELAFGRDPSEYRNAILCERGNRDWAYTLARHWLYDHAEALRLQALEDSTNPQLAALARKIRREERYHLLHADTWIRRVASGPVEGRTKLVDSLGEAFEEAIGLFEPIEHEDEALERRWLPVSSEQLRERFVARAGDALDQLGLPTSIRDRLDESAELVASSSGDLIVEEHDDPSPQARPSGLGGRRGRHSPEFDRLWDDMTFTYRDNPGASW